MASGGITLSFTCNEEHGAILNLKSPAHTRCLFDTKQLREYVMKNYESWKHYATETIGLILEGAEKVVLVRGWVKTSADWTVTAFTSHGSKWTTSFDAQGGAVPVSVGIELANKQDMEGPVVSRFGVGVNAKNKGKGRETALDHDQCVFLKYYSVKYRKFWTSKIEASAGPHRLPENPGDDMDLAVPADATTTDISMENDDASDNVRSSIICG